MLPFSLPETHSSLSTHWKQCAEEAHRRGPCSWKAYYLTQRRWAKYVLNIQLQWLLESQRDSNLNPTYCLSSGELYLIFLSLFPHLKNRCSTAHLVGLWELTLQVVNSLQMFILSISVSSSLIYNWQRRFHHRSSQQSCETHSLRIGSILICGRGKLRLRGLSVEFTRIRLIEWYLSQKPRFLDLCSNVFSTLYIYMWVTKI